MTFSGQSGKKVNLKIDQITVATKVKVISYNGSVTMSDSNVITVNAEAVQWDVKFVIRVVSSSKITFTATYYNCGIKDFTSSGTLTK
jgi:hypothetical protein